MFALQDIVSPAGRALFRQERLDRYAETATAFLRRNLARAVSPLGPEALRHAVMYSYHHARTLGISAESDHLRYASLAALLGLGFEVDPLRASIMVAAGGFTEDGRLTAPLPLSALLANAEAYLARTAGDLTWPRDIAQGIATLRQPDALRSLEGVTAWLHRLWPDRMAALGPQGLGAFLTVAYEVAGRFGLGGHDADSYVMLAPYFGSRFANDPFFPWAGAALSDTAASPDQRMLQLGEGVLAHIRSISGESR